jgi:DNA-binding NarL/FixJ family response regulator
MSVPIRVMLVEDDSLLRESLSMLIDLDPELRVAASVPNGDMALRELSAARPNVILTDLDMPKLDGIQLTAAVHERHPEIAVVVLTKFGDDDRLFSALKAGAIGYLLKDAGVEEIRAAIKDAAEGHGRLSPAIVTKVLSEFSRIQARAAATRDLFSDLTRREFEVLELLGKGYRNRAIGDALSLSEKTVKTHVGAILRKLHLLDRTQAALLAQERGLAPPRTEA